MRLKDRVAIVVGAGQSPGEGMGNGRATALTFAREGAKVLCVDHHPESAQATVDMIGAKGGTAVAFKADVTKSAELKAMVDDALRRWGRIDVLVANAGLQAAGRLLAAFLPGGQAQPGTERRGQQPRGRQPAEQGEAPPR